MPQTPKFGKTPLELLEPNPDYEPPFFGKYAVWIFGPLLGVGASMSVNLGQQRPVLRASVPRHIAYGLIGFFAYRAYRQYRENLCAERDAVYRHYIQLHPEDFPPPERRQFKNVFDEWVPIR